MKIVIPGASGAIARIVATRLAEAGHQVVGIDPRPWAGAPQGVEVHALDIRKRAAEDVFRRVRPDAVVHMATVTHLMERSEDRYRINLGGTRAVFDYCRAYGVAHCVFVGRHTYYGAAPDSPLYHSEDEPPMSSAFPELADLVAADLFAATALWRYPELTTTVLRVCYSLGTTGHGTLATFLKGRRVPTILGFDPLFQFMDEKDIARAIALTVEKKLRGIYNVAGPQPIPLSVVIRETGRTQVPLPEFVLNSLLGRFGLPRLPRGALAHLKYPIVMDAAPFKSASGFSPEYDEVRTLRSFSEAFPAVPEAAARG